MLVGGIFWIAQHVESCTDGTFDVLDSSTGGFVPANPRPLSIFHFVSRFAANGEKTNGADQKNDEWE
jgi:hypothetical protein